MSYTVCMCDVLVLLLLLGQEGTFDAGKLEREREESRRILEQRAIKLELPKPVIASEYYTNEEMVQFKKRKKRKRKEKFKPDELLPLVNEEESKDHGSRKRVVPQESVSEVTEMEVDVSPGVIDRACVTTDHHVHVSFQILFYLMNKIQV